MDRGIAAAAYEAYASTRFLLRSTPLEPAPWLAAAITAATSNAATADAPRVFLKLESEQRTGSFKARGAINKVLRTLRNGGGDGVAGFTTASTGNHALATIMAVQAATTQQQQQQQRQTPLELVIYVAENADATKVARLRTAASASSSSTAVRIRVEVEGRDCGEAEAAARRAAEDDDQTGERGAWRYISPYNDLEVIAGQGSLAVEMLAQLRSARQQQGKQPPQPRPLAVFVPVGGGGLIAGVAAVLKAAASDTMPLIEVYGCQPAINDIMRRSVAEGELLDLPEVAEAATLSDATAGGVEPGAATFDLCQSLVDHWVAVDEQEIADAVCSVLEHSGKLVEGSAGVAIAAALRVARETPERLRGKDVAVVCCGGNVGVATLKKVLERGRAVELGRVTL